MDKIIKDKLVLSSFISGLFYALAYPTIITKLISEVGSKIVSFNAICISIAGIFIPIMWNKYSDTIYKKYGYLFIVETITYSIICVCVILNIISIKSYYILDTILFCIVSKNIICGNNKLKVLRYKDKERETFDNNISLVGDASSLVGFIISFILNIPINIAFICITIGICADNFAYFISWKKSIKIKMKEGN